MINFYGDKEKDLLIVQVRYRLMKLSKKEVDEIYDSVCNVQDKIIKTVKTERGFDDKRIDLVKKLKKNHNKRIIRSLIKIYQKEKTFFSQLKKEIDSIKKLEKELKDLAESSRLMQTLMPFMYKNKSRLNFKSAALVKYSYRLLKKYGRKSANLHKQISKSVVKQLEVLKQIEGGDLSKKGIFLRNLERDNKIISKFHKPGIDRRVVNLIYRAKTWQAIVLLIIFNLPGAGHIIPILAPFFGIHIASAFATLAETVKWGSFFWLAHHITKK